MNTTDDSFGQTTVQKSQRLLDLGNDANQVANILCKEDAQGCNYGIGIVLGGDGKPAASSPTLLEYAAAEVNNSSSGTYLNSAAVQKELLKAVLSWQRIPQNHWDKFKLILPSDAGTGAVQTAVQVALMLNPSLKTLGVEELGWPAYRTIAKVARVDFKEYPTEKPIDENDTLPLYQAGPMNTTGFFASPDMIRARAESAAQRKVPVVLDRAYSGFEFARLAGNESYDALMRRSYELHVSPFVDAGVSFVLALSPTKAFVTFALRPCGFLLACNHDPARDKELSLALTAAIRARGSSFEHPVTRAFVKALLKDRARLENEHLNVLKRLADAEQIWRDLAKGTPIEYAFSDRYAGLFRNLNAREDAPVHLYGEHVYPVFASGRCRLNVTGIPSDRELAKKHVGLFAKYCR